MELSQERMYKQLQRMKPFLNNCSIELARKGQDALGAFLRRSHQDQVETSQIEFDGFSACMARPKERAAAGRILYLHGGGYVCGDLAYASGFGAVLAAITGAEVLCPAYRLAPENPFPTGLEDAWAAYQSLAGQGVQDLILCGESAGGGMIYALCLLAKEKGFAMPAGLVAISPWTDLTASGCSYKDNREQDPSMTPERLRFFADCYTQDQTNPLVSPLFGDLKHIPPSLIFVGGDEIMLDDSRLLHQRLLASGCDSTLMVAPGLWHAYILYSLRERHSDLALLRDFCQARFKPEQ